MASKPGGLNIKEWLQPRKESHTEVASVDGVDSRPAALTRKADVLWEEMGICTIGATGVRVQAPRGGSGDNAGKDHLPAGANGDLQRPFGIV